MVQSNEVDIIAGLPHAEKNVTSFNQLIKNLQLYDISRQKIVTRKCFHGNLKLHSQPEDWIISLSIQN